MDHPQAYYKFLSKEYFNSGDATKCVAYYDEGLKAGLCEQDAYDYALLRFYGLTPTRAYSAILNSILRQV